MQTVYVSTVRQKRTPPLDMQYQCSLSTISIRIKCSSRSMCYYYGRLRYTVVHRCAGDHPAACGIAPGRCRCAVAASCMQAGAPAAGAAEGDCGERRRPRGGRGAAEGRPWAKGRPRRRGAAERREGRPRGGARLGSVLSSWAWRASSRCPVTPCGDRGGADSIETVLRVRPRARRESAWAVLSVYTGPSL